MLNKLFLLTKKMGAAQSSNVAQATSEIANNVSDTTSVNTTKQKNLYLKKIVLHFQDHHHLHLLLV